MSGCGPPSEASFGKEQIERVGLLSRPGFELWVVAEVPSVLFHLPRYSELVAEVFDERDPAVTEYIAHLIGRAADLGLKTSICGQAPSVYSEYAELLVGAGIDAISVNIDAVEKARRLIWAAESGPSDLATSRGGER